MQHGEGEMLVTETAVHHHLDERQQWARQLSQSKHYLVRAEEECFFCHSSLLKCCFWLSLKSAQIKDHQHCLCPMRCSSLCFNSSTTHSLLIGISFRLGTSWQRFWKFKKIQNLPVLDFLALFPVLLSEGTGKRSNLLLKPPLPSPKYFLSGLHSLKQFSQVILSTPLS